MKAVPNFADIGPTRLFVRRSSCKAELATCESSVVFALVVVLGWTTSVAAMARCCGDGMKTGLDVTVPEERIFRRRLKAWLSKIQEILIRQGCYMKTRQFATSRRTTDTYRALLRSISGSAALVRTELISLGDTEFCFLSLRAPCLPPWRKLYCCRE